MNAPCRDCPERCIGCRRSCRRWKAYQLTLKIIKVQQNLYDESQRTVALYQEEQLCWQGRYSADESVKILRKEEINV